MFARLNHIHLLRYAGLFTWAVVGLPLLYLWVAPLAGAGEAQALELDRRHWQGWAAYAAFGLSYLVLTRGLGVRARSAGDYVLLVVLTAAAIAVSYFGESGLGSLLLTVVACLLPWLLSLPMGVTWLVVSQLAMVPIFMLGLGFPLLEALMLSMLYTGFSLFIFVTSLIARQQAQARDEQRRLNAELRATRALLGESVRVNERTRISRELHDLLGHHLTALSLNLEVASHLAEGRVKDHVQQAHTLARLLLTDVREAVSQLREGGGMDLAVALRPLAENVPALAIHMDIAEPLTMDDPERAHVLLRCTQEIITNTVRHAAAQNLWISARRELDCVVMQARDDGRGADQFAAGNGLRGMRERLAQYGGELAIDTRPDAGFSLRLKLPASVLAVACEGASA